MAHALLSPSKAERWIQCPPSALLESKEPDGASPYADEGTEAHRACEIEVSYAAALIGCKEYDKQVADFKRSAKHYNPVMFDHAIDFRDFVMSTFERLKERDKSTTLEVESRVNLDAYVDNSFGTRDVCIRGAGELHIIDYKYGQGVKVYAANNAQMRLYALGSLTGGDSTAKVVTTIYQPRLNHIDSEVLRPKDLYKWAIEVLRPAVKLAVNGAGELKAGDHCKFCKIKAKCKALADYALGAEIHGFAEAQYLKPSDYADLRKRAEVLASWLGSVNEYITSQMLAGVTFEGLKLVEGRSVRKYSDEGNVCLALKNNGYAPEKYLKTALKGITELQKELGRSAFAGIVEPLLIKPAGKPTIVADTDPRPVYSPANVDFKDLINEDEN